MLDKSTKMFVFVAAILAGIIPLIPFIIGHLNSIGSDSYLGYQYATDDQMVYAAWIRQAMDGRILFDNRFTTDIQPGLTINIFFLVLGWIAKLVGIVWSTTLVRALLNVGFILLLSKLVSKLTDNAYKHKLALTLTVIGGGIGFSVWHAFGEAIVKPTPQILASVLQGRLPIDVWQPEAFVFPSMLTNALFMASLCLFLVIIICILESKGSWKPVVPGFFAFLLLANFHSYDVAFLGMALVAFLIGVIVNRQSSWLWVLRCFTMVLGVVPPALWMAHVLRVDPVFQARAATETYSPAFRQVLFGILPLIALALIRLYTLEAPLFRKLASMVSLVALLAAMAFVPPAEPSSFWLSMPIWIMAFLCSVTIATLISGCTNAERLIWTFALVGLVAIYFPVLFQRKLSTGMSISWALLASLGFGGVAIKHLERSKRNLTTVLVIIVCGGSSVLWFTRELSFIKDNVSRTTVHPVYLSSDTQKILNYINEHRQTRTVVLAMPGVASPNQQGLVDRFNTPVVPDLNPIVSGLTGAYTFAGHWSETPHYLKRRDELTRFFIEGADSRLSLKLLKDTKPDYIIAPVPESFTILPVKLRDMRVFGKVVLDGLQFRLIKVEPEIYSGLDGL